MTKVLEAALDGEAREDAEGISDDNTEQETNYEISKTMQHVKLPRKVGGPAFSIHAEKVYILYPSLFQDPNIFGRFSIPQNVNLDPSSAKSYMQANDYAADEESSEDLPSTAGTGMMRRQASNPNSVDSKPPPKRKEQNRNVETHLTGSIVVLNQDVNEVNSKEGY